MKKKIHLKRNLTFLCLTFSAGQTVLPAVSKKLLDYFIHGDEEFIKCRQERFIKKRKLWSETIKLINLLKFTEASRNQNQVSNKIVVKSTKKDIDISQRKTDIAKAKGYDTK